MSPPLFVVSERTGSVSVVFAYLAGGYLEQVLEELCHMYNCFLLWKDPGS